MDVIIANKHKEELDNLDIDVIKSISGEYGVADIGEMFKNFFFDRMVIDVTALKGNDDTNTYQRLVKYLDPDKIVFLLPEGSALCTPSFLSKLISYGIYNFTTNVSGVSYLLGKPNTYKEVEHIAKMAAAKPEPEPVPEEVEETHSFTPVPETPKKTVVQRAKHIVGIRNVTESAGATTLTYMMLKELAIVYGHENVLAIEIDKNDFAYFYDKRMLSIKQVDLRGVLEKYANIQVLLVDLNGLRDDSFCDDVIYLIEPSTLKLNRLMQRNRIIFQSLTNKKVVLNQSILQNNDVFDFESESGVKIFYNIPPLDERKRNSVIADFLSKVGLIHSGQGDFSSGKIFGLFRR